MKPKRKRVNRKAEEVPSQLEKISPPDIQAIPEEPPIITMKMLELALQSTRQSMKDITLREEVPLHRSILIEVRVITENFDSSMLTCYHKKSGVSEN